MTIYIRDKNNNTICDIEIWTEKDNFNNDYVDISSVVDIESYSELLLNNTEKTEILVNDFIFIQELRGWLFEFFSVKDKLGAKHKPTVVYHVKEILKEICAVHGLFMLHED